MVKFLLRKTRAVFLSLVVIITIITIMLLKHSHLRELTMDVSLKYRIYAQISSILSFMEALLYFVKCRVIQTESNTYSWPPLDRNSAFYNV